MAKEKSFIVTDQGKVVVQLRSDRFERPKGYIINKLYKFILNVQKTFK